VILEYKNKEDYIYAYITWYITDHDNRITADGEIVVVNGTWVHKDYRTEPPLAHVGFDPAPADCKNCPDVP